MFRETLNELLRGRIAALRGVGFGRFASHRLRRCEPSPKLGFGLRRNFVFAPCLSAFDMSRLLRSVRLAFGLPPYVFWQPAGQPHLAVVPTVSAHRVRRSGKDPFGGASGFALIVVLLLLVALSLVGVAALRSTSLQEKMAGNLYFKAQSMQDAEAALRSTAARMDSLLGRTATTVPATSASSPNWREFSASFALSSVLRTPSTWTGTRPLDSLARSSINVNAVTESMGISELIGCDVNAARPGACKFRFTRMSSRATDSVTGASSIVQQYWTFPN